MFRWVSTKEIARNVGLRSEPSLEKTLAFIAQSKADESINAFAIYFKDQHAGNVILDQRDTWLQAARLSIYIGEPTARGCGVGSSAVYRAAEIGFSALGLNKIWLHVHIDNTAAIESYKRVGFQIEGTLRDEFKLDGHFVSTFYMGLLRNDFQRVKA